MVKRTESLFFLHAFHFLAIQTMLGPVHIAVFNLNTMQIQMHMKYQQN